MTLQPEAPDRSPTEQNSGERALLSVRSALIFLLAVLAAAGAAGLGHWAGWPVPVIIGAACAGFAGAIPFFNKIIA